MLHSNQRKTQKILGKEIQQGKLKIMNNGHLFYPITSTYKFLSKCTFPIKSADLSQINDVVKFFPARYKSSPCFLLIGSITQLASSKDNLTYLGLKEPMVLNIIGRRINPNKKYYDSYI